WIIQGLAYFGDIISKHKGNLEELSDEVLKHLVKYVDARQGVMARAIKDEEGVEYLKNAAKYGLTRDRLFTDRIEPGEGLIGATYKDREKKYLVNIPQNYTKVESGLGSVDPARLILLPLKTEDEIYGVVELAFFEEVSSV